ncbi:MAG: cytochrome c [Deltaproteobacteria bacterium]|nr:MAG: cytochrome c [Deltaproteobacteria bacterium]
MRLILLSLALTACGATNPNQANYDRVRAEVREELGLDHHHAEDVKDTQATATEVGGSIDPDAEEAAPDPVARGKEVYNTYCVACHGADGKGNNGQAASFPDDPARLAKSDAALVKSIREGVSGDVGIMPPWGSVVNEQDAKAAVAYIRSEWGE